MNNALLIGLSRQTALRRELDVVANNLANINTTGFKADGAVFGEYMQDNARTQNAGQQRRLSFVQDRMSWHDFSQGTVQPTGNPLDVAIDGEGMLVVQTDNGERYTRNGALQLNNAGELVTSTGDKVMGDGGVIVLQNTERQLGFDARQAPHRPLRQHAAAPQGGPQHLSGARGHNPDRGRAAERHSGRGREIQCQIRDCDDAHDRSVARLHRGRHHSPAAERDAEELAPAARRSAGVTLKRKSPCAHCTPPRPE
jgi:flagellar hook-basal body protein